MRYLGQQGVKCTCGNGELGRAANVAKQVSCRTTETTPILWKGFRYHQCADLLWKSIINNQEQMIIIRRFE